MVAVAAAEREVVVRNFWLDRKKNLAAVEQETSLSRVGIRRLGLYIQKQIQIYWHEDPSVRSFSRKMKDLLDQLRRRGACCEYTFICDEESISIGIGSFYKPNEKVSWEYLEQKLV